jgi:hypothetical protein
MNLGGGGVEVGVCEGWEGERGGGRGGGRGWERGWKGRVGGEKRGSA